MESKPTRNVSCSNCSQIFSVRDPLHPRGLRCPFILHCGHSVCENCIRSSLRNTDQVICGICKHISTAAHQHTDVRLDFPLNIYLVGVFAARHWGQEPEDSKVTFVPSGSSSTHKASTSKGMQQNHKRDICAECVEQTAKWKCHQCEVLYCDHCFTVVHKAAKALSKHKKSALDEACQQPEFEQPVCDDHPLQKIEFFCKDCSKFVCSHCVICLHQGHGVITKKQKNEAGVAELDDAREKAAEVLKRLLHTQKKVGEVLMVPTTGKKLTPVEQEVTRHFVYLHGALQLLEQNLMERLRCAKTETKHSLDLVVNELNSNIKHVRQLLEEAVAAKDPANINKVELSSITDKLQAVQQLPIHLVTSDGNNADTLIRFVVDESFLTQINNHCQLEIHAASSYSLVKTEDLPPDYVLELIDEDTESDTVMLASSRASSVSAISEATSQDMEQADPNRSYRSTNSTSSKNATFSTNAVKGSSDIVTVCHVRDPSSFYVHRVADRMTLESFCSQLSKHVHTFSTPPQSVLKDGLYMVQYQEDKKWYRARVRSVLPSSSENTEEKLVDILYIDYGNTEVIPCTRLRCIPPVFAHTPAMALHCSLFELVPCNDKWSQEAVGTFAVMVNSRRVRMVVMEHSADTYQVDLCQLPGDAENSEVPVSVRDALVFLEYASLVAQTEPKVTLPQRTVEYFQEKDFKKGDAVDVVVSHVDSPHSFYVQRLGEHARYLTSVMKDMNTEYTNAGNKGLIYAPQVGMPCAAQYTVDKRWYRAKIIALPGNKMVEVFYVDYGNQELMAWNQIRKLHSRFLRLPAQAIHCSLNDIVPSQQQWTPAVKEYLMKVTARKILYLYVDEVQTRQLKVTLYESQADVDVCINALLVREGYGTSVGASSSFVEYHKLDGVPHPPLSGTKRTQSRFTKKKPVANVKAQCLSNAGDMTDPKESEADKYKVAEDPLLLEVKVLSCLSPSCIYVALCAQEEKMNDLMRELQEYYATSNSYIDNWEVNNKCCAFSVKYKQWYRAIIVDLKLPNQQVKVFLKDIAEVEVVPLTNLQLLDPKFLTLHDGAIKCHLAGVRAAGDKTEWPGVACEYLRDQIAEYPYIFITKKGEIENWSLPVELWVKKMKPGGPLEPAQEEWHILNKKLVDQGFAIPIRGESEVQSIPSLQVLKELYEQSREANENNVAYWLPLSVQTDDVIKTESGEVAADVNGSGSVTDTENETIAEQEEESQSFARTDWLPAEPVSQKTFIATPTYVDDDGFIYLHDTEKSGETLRIIGNAFYLRFNSSRPKPHDLYWFVGQLCIAQYHADEKWYRGKVVGVNDDRTVKVAFVDYGNIEDCKASDMRKNVYMDDIPIQCHKCQLDRIKPVSDDGKWPLSTLDFIHTTIVEKQCEVTVKQEPKIGQPLVISLLGPGNIDIGELLVRLQFAIYVRAPEFDMASNSETGMSDDEASVIIEGEDDAEVIVENEETEVTAEVEEETGSSAEDREEAEVSNEDPDDKEGGNSERNVSDVTSPEGDEHLEWNALIEKEQELQKIATGNILHYKQLELPYNDTIAVEVTAILSATEVIIHPCKVKGSELLEMKERFERLTEDLQKEAQSQPLIKKPYIGQPCCARYTADDRWYRASVLSVEPREAKQLKIQYVDYGNVEYQPRDKVHILKPEWTAVPVQGIRCRMWHIQRPDDWDPKVLFPKLMECLFHPPLLAKIKAQQPLLQVQLFTSDGSKLILQPLVDAGLLIVEKEEQSVCDTV